jgi:nucleoside-diphosphate-sugar epimerase
VKHALILGAGSQITPFLTRRLASAGYQGMAVSRRPPCPGLAEGFPWRALDVTSPGDWAWAPEKTVVISLLPIWLLPAFLPRLANASQVIAFSSTSRFTKHDSTDSKEKEVAQCLAEGEAGLAERCRGIGIPWTVLRPTLVYGAGRDENVTAIARFIQRYGVFPLARPGNGLRQPVHTDDLAMAAVAAIDNARANNVDINLPGGETLSYKAMVERIFNELGKKPRIIMLPPALYRSLYRLLGFIAAVDYSQNAIDRMNQDLTFELGPSRALLGYHPRGFEFRLPPY